MGCKSIKKKLEYRHLFPNIGSLWTLIGNKCHDTVSFSRRNILANYYNMATEAENSQEDSSLPTIKQLGLKIIGLLTSFILLSTAQL